MSPKLKPLLLPRLVEQRRNHETLVQQGTGEVDQTFVYYSQRLSSSSSDLASPSPETPTFSLSRSHSRYSDSTSSLEQYNEGTASPISASVPTLGQQTGNGNAITTKPSKSVLPDVQEDPVREDEELTPPVGGNDNNGLYDCLCDEPCTHRESESPLGMGSDFAYLGCPADMDYYYDVGFFSDGEYTMAERPRKHQSLNGAESPFGRIGARLSGGLSRWRSSSKRSRAFTFSPASDPSISQVAGRSRATSRAASSRSSSISAPSRHMPDRTNEPPLPPTPALSFYESTDSIALTSSQHDEIDQTSAGQSLERERAMATTPLLPPLITENLNAMEAAVSPLQSPSVAEPPAAQQETLYYPTPPLSSRPSVSSFHPAYPSLPTSQTVFSAVSSPVNELPSPIPNLIEHDEWSDRLGHANFIITPRPYRPTTVSLEALSGLLRDWDLARINYTRHLCRTGEHYGTTSNTYQLTQAKWADIERQWLAIHDELSDTIIKTGSHEADAALEIRRGRQEDVTPSAIPKMLDAEGKFPERGDVDIVGPMQRDAVMVRDLSSLEDRRHVSTWLKSIVGRVSLRK